MNRAIASVPEAARRRDHGLLRQGLPV